MAALSKTLKEKQAEFNEKKTALCRYRDGRYFKIRDYSKKGVWGVRARNKEQAFAFKFASNQLKNDKKFIIQAMSMKEQKKSVLMITMR